MTDGQEREDGEKDEQTVDSGSDTSINTTAEPPAESPNDVQLDTTSPDTANHPEMAVEPNKRLSDTEPIELAHALRQVFNGTDDKTNYRPIAVSPTTMNRAPQGQNAATQDTSPQEPEGKSGYTNPLALFADVFYGVLIAPRPTFSILSNSTKFPPTLANLFLSFILVFVALALPGAIKVGAAANTAEGLLKASAFVLGNLADWALLSLILYYLSIWLRGNKLTLGNAFIVTGWAYLPFAFFAPVACFKGALGNAFTMFACLPAMWFIVLQWLAFQTALRTTTIKLALIALVVPPVFCLVYLFWIGLAVFSLLSQLIAHLT
jgi:Yip1 domain